MTTPPAKEAFFICDLVEKRGLVGIQFFEDGSHKRFTNNSATVLHSVFLTKAIERTLLAFVQQDGYSMFARGFPGHIRNRAQI